MSPVESNPLLVIQLLRDGNRDVWSMRLSGADTLRLTTHPGEDLRPAVAGDRVLFVSYRDGNGELYAVPVTGGPEQRLTNTPFHEGDPAATSSTSRIVFTSDSSGVPRLQVANRDLTGSRSLTTDSGISGSLEASPAWNPSGTEVAFTSTATGQATVAKVGVGGGSATTLVGTLPPNVEPAWSPDGRTIAFVSARDGDAEIYLFTIATSQVRRLTNRAGIDRRPQFLPDGRVLWLAQTGATWKMLWTSAEGSAEVHEVPLPSGTVEWVAVRR